MDKVKEAQAAVEMHLERFKFDHRMAVCEDIIRAQQVMILALADEVERRTKPVAAESL